MLSLKKLLVIKNQDKIIVSVVETHIPTDAQVSSVCLDTAKYSITLLTLRTDSDLECAYQCLIFNYQKCILSELVFCKYS